MSHKKLAPDAVLRADHRQAARFLHIRVNKIRLAGHLSHCLKSVLMRRAGCARATLAAALFLPNVVFGQAKNLSGMPTKIEITSDSLTPVKGENVKVSVRLLDPENHAAAANKDFEVQIVGRSQSGAIEKSKVLIKTGQTEQVTQLPVKDSGITEFIASNQELAEGGTIVNVRASPQTGPSVVETPTPTASAAPGSTSVPSEETPSGHPAIRSNETTTTTTEHPSEYETKLWETRYHGGNGSSGTGSTRTGSALKRSPAASGRIEFGMTPLPTHGGLSLPAPTVTPTVVAGSNWNPSLTFLYYPKRPVRADSNDAATVWATLPADDPARADLSIYLLSDVGPLTPEPIKIPQGGIVGAATLVADHPADVQVWYQYSTPSAKAPSQPLTITFCSPVWALRVVPRSPKIGLFESARIGVELVDFRNTNVPPDKRRELHLRLASGSGELGDAPPAFDTVTGGYVEAKFTPTWPGVVKVIATSPFLQEASGSFTVAPPFSLLLFCAFGGFLGGVLAYLREKSTASWRRIVIGLITGFVLYWGVLFGPIPIPVSLHGFLLNPFSVTIIAICGGWMGTEVFTFLFNKLGWKW